MLHENDEPELDALASTLQWGHLCPTAPDTLSCHPLTVDDPFVISQLNPPDIFFAGNQVRYVRQRSPSWLSKLATD
jgi:DNA polymerase delta subunit 2